MNPGDGDGVDDFIAGRVSMLTQNPILIANASAWAMPGS